MEPTLGLQPKSKLYESLILALNYVGIIMEPSLELESSSPAYKTGASPHMLQGHIKEQIGAVSGIETSPQTWQARMQPSTPIPHKIGGTSGIETASSVCKTDVIPLYHGPIKKEKFEVCIFCALPLG
jgi:hypothetical protein